MIDEPLFYLAAIPAVLISGISKGGFGGGLGVVAVPLMSLAVSPIQAVSIMLPILSCMDIVGVWVYWRKWDAHSLVVLVLGGIVGIALGGIAFSFLNAGSIKLFIGTIAVLFTLNHWFAARLRQDRPAAKPNALRGGFWGMVSGFTSTVAHAGSPPVAIYMMPLRFDRTTYHATTVFHFLAVNYLKIIPFGLLGQFSVGNLSTSAVLLPFALAGSFLGIWLHRKVSQTVFYRLCYGFLFIVGCKLLWDGMASLFA